jgi:hypothetical protein
MAASQVAQAFYATATVDSNGQVTGKVVSGSSVGGIVLGKDGQTFSVNLAHQYAEEGSYTITVTILHDSTPAQVVTTTASVSDPAPVVTAGKGFSATEGVTSGAQSVATFTDPGGPESDSSAYTATVAWGDGNSSTATLANGGIVLGKDGQTFSVNLAHQYAEEGSYTITVSVTHDGVPSSPVTLTANVADNDSLSATGGSLAGTYGTALTGVTVATFTDTDTGAPASDFVATIDWGDGKTSSGTVSGSNGSFTVTGSHNYAGAGTYAINVTIADDDAGTAQAKASTTATINRLAVTLGGSRPYDGTPTAAAGILSITDLISGDNVTLSGSATLAGAGVGSQAIVSFAGLTLGGPSAGNYTLTGASGSVSISPLVVTLGGSRPYDGTPTAAAGILSITDLVSGDNVTLSGSATLAGANAGPETITSVAGLKLGGTSAANYTLTGASGSVTITAATLSVTPININPTAGAPFNGPLATITNNVDPNGGNDYTVVISWGDGSTSNGTITGSGSTLTVTGSHTYTDPVNETVTVTITNNQGNTSKATVTDTATVTNLGKGVTKGQTATIGFWHNQNGQALINKFNGGSTATALSAWLVATFPNLYGAGTGSNNLTGLTNVQVAAYYKTLFNMGGPKAQVLAVALNVYATTSSLGGSWGATYGFTASAAGLGAYSFNVGADGAAFGVANNTTLNVYELLQAVNKKAAKGVLYGGDATLQSECADLFTALNNAGDIG